MGTTVVIWAFVSEDAGGVVAIVFTKEGVVSGAAVVTSGSLVLVSVTSCGVTLVILVTDKVVLANSVTLSVICSEAGCDSVVVVESDEDKSDVLVVSSKFVAGVLVVSVLSVVVVVVCDGVDVSGLVVSALSDSVTCDPISVVNEGVVDCTISARGSNAKGVVSVCRICTSLSGTLF